MITAVDAAYRWRWSGVGGSIGALLGRLASRRQQLFHASLYRVFHPRGSHLLVRVRPFARVRVRARNKIFNEMPVNELSVSTWELAKKRPFQNGFALQNREMQPRYIGKTRADKNISLGLACVWPSCASARPGSLRATTRYREKNLLVGVRTSQTPLFVQHRTRQYPLPRRHVYIHLPLFSKSNRVRDGRLGVTVVTTCKAYGCRQTPSLSRRVCSGKNYAITRWRKSRQHDTHLCRQRAGLVLSSGICPPLHQ